MPAAPSIWRSKYVDGFNQLPWVTQSSPRRLRFVLVALIITGLWCIWAVDRGLITTTSMSSVKSAMLHPAGFLDSSSPAEADPDLSPAEAANRLPHLPAKVWQVYLDYSPSAIEPTPFQSWILNSPSHAYTIVDASSASARIAQLSKTREYADIVRLYNAMTRRVLRGDFLRYLLLATEGGVYSDMDTEMMRPVRDWVPDEFKSQTRLIVGLESDTSPPIFGTTYEVQFCQWTLAGAQGHYVLWKMVDRILAKVRDRVSRNGQETEYSDEDVLAITGPAGWTEVIYEHLSQVTGTEMTWKNLTGMTEPRLYGDTLVLPIDGFATGVPHSNASPEVTDATMVRHLFSGAWKTAENQAEDTGDSLMG